MRRKAGQLEQIRSKRIGEWIDDLKPGSVAAYRALDEFENPGRWTIRRMVDEELADLIASEPGSKLGALAASEMRTREAWRGPARWSLIIAVLAFALSIAAFIRTLPNQITTPEMAKGNVHSGGTVTPHSRKSAVPEAP